jgi:hypothetical protein
MKRHAAPQILPLQPEGLADRSRGYRTPSASNAPGFVPVTGTHSGWGTRAARMASRLSTALLVLTALATFSVPGIAGPKTPKKEESVEEKINFDQPRWIVILGVYKDFAEAKADAQKFSKASSVPFSMRGNVFDKKGLHYPKNFDDELYAGEYLARRTNAHGEAGQELEEYLSIERSDGYDGFAKGYYIVVGAVAETAKDGLAQAERFKAFSKDTYVKKTIIYMGCLH